MNILTDSPWRVQPENTRQGKSEIGPWTVVMPDGYTLGTPCSSVVTKNRIYTHHYETVKTASIEGGIIGGDWEEIQVANTTFFPRRRTHGIDVIGSRLYLHSSWEQRAFSFNDVSGEFIPESGHIVNYPTPDGYPLSPEGSFVVCNKLYISRPWDAMDRVQPYTGCVPVDDFGDLGGVDEWILNVEPRDLRYYNYTKRLSAKALNSIKNTIRVYCFSIVNEEVEGKGFGFLLIRYLDFTVPTGNPIGNWVECPKIDVELEPYAASDFSRIWTCILCVASTAKYIYIFYYCNREDTEIHGTNSHYINVNLVSLEIGENAEIKSHNVYKNIYQVPELNYEWQNAGRTFDPIITSSRIYHIFENSDGNFVHAWAPFNENAQPVTTRNFTGSWRHPTLTVRGNLEVERKPSPVVHHSFTGSWRHPALTVRGNLKVERPPLPVGRHVFTGSWRHPALTVRGNLKTYARHVAQGRIVMRRPRIRATMNIDNDWVLRFKRKEVL